MMPQRASFGPSGGFPGGIDGDAAQDLKLSYHNMDIYRTVWFLNYGKSI